MNVKQAIAGRRSIRKFKSEAIPNEMIDTLLEAARIAPSGSNMQPTRYVVIKSEQARHAIGECTPLAFVAQAPVVLACCVDNNSFNQAGERYQELVEDGAFAGFPLDADTMGERMRKRGEDKAAAKAYLWLNAAISIDHVTLQAEELGLGTCWVMMVDQEKAKQVLGLEERYSVVALLPVGFPDQHPSARPRLPLSEILLKEI